MFSMLLCVTCGLFDCVLGAPRTSQVTVGALVKRLQWPPLKPCPPHYIITSRSLRNSNRGEELTKDKKTK